MVNMPNDNECLSVLNLKMNKSFKKEEDVDINGKIKISINYV